MKKRLKNNKAITLISLVVTIIILLILAGVTIGFAINGTGLFDKAKLATDKYNNSVDIEDFELEQVKNQIDIPIDSNRNTQPVEKITFSDTVSGYTIAYNNSVKIGDMVYLDFRLDKNSGYWPTGWQYKMTKVSIAPKSSVYFVNHGLNHGIAVGEVYIEADGTINYYIMNNYSLERNCVVNAFYYVGG